MTLYKEKSVVRNQRINPSPLLELEVIQYIPVSCSGIDTASPDKGVAF